MSLARHTPVTHLSHTTRTYTHTGGATSTLTRPSQKEELGSFKKNQNTSQEAPSAQFLREVVQCVAFFCSLFKHCCRLFNTVAVCCSVVVPLRPVFVQGVWYCVVVCCSGLQCVAVCCSVLHPCRRPLPLTFGAIVCCSVLQSIAMCCSTNSPLCWSSNLLSFGARYVYKLQYSNTHTARHRNKQQHTGTHCSTRSIFARGTHCSTLQQTTTYGITLQYNTLQHSTAPFLHAPSAA